MKNPAIQKCDLSVGGRGDVEYVVEGVVVCACEVVDGSVVIVVDSGFGIVEVLGSFSVVVVWSVDVDMYIQSKPTQSPGK